MRAVVQRVQCARVLVDGAPIAEIGPGLLVLVGIASDDSIAAASLLAEKVVGLRVFDDTAGTMNLSLTEAGGSVLCVSQFTLYGDVRRGRRLSFGRAAAAEVARPLYEAFCSEVEGRGTRCARGAFGAEMIVELRNDGPVTLVIDTDLLTQPRRA